MRGCLICWKCARRLALIDLQRAAVNLRVLPPISKICQFSFSALLSPAVVLGWKRKNNIKALYYLEIQMDNFQKTHCWAFLGWWYLLYTITGSSWCKHLFLMTVNVESLVYGCSVAFSISKAWKRCHIEQIGSPLSHVKIFGPVARKKMYWAICIQGCVITTLTVWQSRSSTGFSVARLLLRAFWSPVLKSVDVQT